MPRPKGCPHPNYAPCPFCGWDDSDFPAPKPRSSIVTITVHLNDKVIKVQSTRDGNLMTMFDGERIINNWERNLVTDRMASLYAMEKARDL